MNFEQQMEVVKANPSQVMKQEMMMQMNI